MKGNFWHKYFRKGYNAQGTRAAHFNGWCVKADAKTTRTRLNRELDTLINPNEQDEMLYNLKNNKIMDFGKAIENLKNGKKVARKGWNGKGMFLVLQPGSEVSGLDMRNYLAREYYGSSLVRIAPHIDLKAADDTYVVGWTASQQDMLSEDWEVIE